MNKEFLSKDQQMKIIGLLNYIEDLVYCAKWKHEKPEEYREEYRDYWCPEDAIKLAMKLKDAGEQEHCGDCTDLPSTCVRCVYEEWIEKLDKYLECFKEDLGLEENESPNKNVPILKSEFLSEGYEPNTRNPR